MDLTMKELADELGVSKQTVYKRATGKLKQELAPYMYIKFNMTYIQEPGADIIREDFRRFPSLPSKSGALQGTYVSENEANRSTSVSDTPKAYGADTEQIRSSTNESTANTVSIQVSSNTDTSDIQSAYKANQGNAPEHSVSDTNFIQSDSADTGVTYGVYTTLNMEHSSHVPYDIHHEYTPHTEQMGSEYGAYTYLQNENTRMRTELDEKTEEMHNQAIELAKSQSDADHLKQMVEMLNERLKEKDALIAEQKLTIERTDAERKVLTASLFKNSQFIEKLMQLPLSKRIFGWKDVQKKLTSSQNDMSDDVAGQGSDEIQTDSNE